MKLAIISHTEHYKNPSGQIVGWGPTVTEINHLIQDFEAIYHLAYLHTEEAPPSALPYSSEYIHFLPLSPRGGKSWSDKLGILKGIPETLRAVRDLVGEVDAIQFRAPTGMGVYLIPYLSGLKSPKVWFKYAGNWNQNQPPLGYALQRYWLKKQNRPVTINGAWPEQPAHCITFENPCLTQAERKEGAAIIAQKSYAAPFRFCFVGRLEDEKGVQRILDAFAGLPGSAVAQIDFIGNGAKREQYEEQAQAQQLPARFHGFLERDAVFECYKKAHFLLLPSDSEGFPKVIAEAMNYGCIPIVSDVSCIGQYVKRENGYKMESIDRLGLQKAIQQALVADVTKRKTQARACHAVAAHFTYDHYRQRIKDMLAQY
jgi:glycosyltransferase involved in cell wall biosynthesis